MTKRVKLPESLGGAEVEAIEADPLPMTLAGVPMTAVRVEGVGWCGVPTRALAEVPPPLPPEPEIGSFVACGGDGNLLPFFRRWSEGWSVVSRDPQFSDVDSWAAVVALARERAKRDPVVLAPVPEPVTLPPEIHDVVAFAIARAEKEPCSTGHYAMAERVVEELRVRGMLSADDEAEREQ